MPVVGKLISTSFYKTVTKSNRDKILFVENNDQIEKSSLLSPKILERPVTSPQAIKDKTIGVKLIRGLSDVSASAELKKAPNF